MYVIYNKNHIHYLLNEPKTWIFAYNCDWKVYNRNVSLESANFSSIKKKWGVKRFPRSNLTFLNKRSNLT